LTTNEVIERVNVDGGFPSGTAAVDLSNNAVRYYTADVTGNWTFNLRGDGSNALNSFMANGDSMTCAILVTNGSNPYYMTNLQIDGVAVTPKWASGNAPTSGNADSIDVYTFTVIKTADATFTVLASQSAFA